MTEPFRTTRIESPVDSAPAKGKVTFAEWFQEWADRQVWTPGTVEVAQQSGRSVTFGDVALRDLRPLHVEQWVKTMSLPAATRKAGLAPTTIKTRFNYVRMALRAAVRNHMLGTDPSDDVQLPRRRKAEVAMAIPSPEQVRVALDAAPEWFRPFIGVCAFAVCASARRPGCSSVT